MIKKLLVFFLTIFTMTAYAQNVTMTGTVVDTDNLPLIGVNVVIKGNPLAELSQCILDSSNGSIINVI